MLTRPSPLFPYTFSKRSSGLLYCRGCLESIVKYLFLSRGLEEANVIVLLFSNSILLHTLVF